MPGRRMKAIVIVTSQIEEQLYHMSISSVKGVMAILLAVTCT
jgi:hypothetical protein